MRLLCGLRQIDCWAATGIPIHRLSGAERGLLRLTHSEERLLITFLRERWKNTRESEAKVPACAELAASALAGAGQD